MIFGILLIGLSLAQEVQPAKPVFKETAIQAPLLEQFTSDWNSRWFPSVAKKEVDGVEDEDLLLYRGEWSVEEPEMQLIENDKGLVLKTLASHSAIAAKFTKPVSNKGKTLVVQYEVNFQNGLECGGAYIKLLTHDPKFEPKLFKDTTPYTIMFGPDKCGANNKVHFIFRHTSPKTGKIEEKHLVSPPTAVTDKKTLLYTLIVRPDQTFDILINNESVKSGSLLTDFAPSVNPEKQIDDPNDQKPSNWVEEEKVLDSSDVKPSDWDESEPKEILDEAATQPEDWLENEPELIPDPKVIKPEDWDDEEDGDWTAPSVANAICATVSGCGKWVRPMVKNVLYKGKWTAKMIANVLYKGPWAPKKIDNPDYFEDLEPSNFNTMGAAGFELWSMQSGFLFDNIYVGHSEADAKKLAEETWVIKNKLEKDLEPVVPEVDYVEKAKDIASQAQGLLVDAQTQLLDFVSLAQEDFVGAVKELPHIAGILLMIVLLPLLALFSALGSGSKDEKKKDEPQEKEVKTTAKATGVEASKISKKGVKKAE